MCLLEMASQDKNERGCRLDRNPVGTFGVGCVYSHQGGWCGSVHVRDERL